MYKKVIALLPAAAAAIWIAATMEQSYTEPTLITGAAYLPEDTAAAAEVIEEADTTTAPEITTAFETTAVPETTAAPETTTAPETTAVPETTAAPETTSAPETTAAPETTVAELQENTVYWVKGGAVWHVRASCSSLARSKDILSGTAEAAMAAGKERVCKRCGA